MIDIDIYYDSGGVYYIFDCIFASIYPEVV